MRLHCPFCGHEDAEASYDIYALPPRVAGYAQVYRCRQCRRFFAPLDNNIPLPLESLQTEYTSGA